MAERPILGKRLRPQRYKFNPYSQQFTDKCLTEKGERFSRLVSLFRYEILEIVCASPASTILLAFFRALQQTSLQTNLSQRALVYWALGLQRILHISSSQSS